MYIYYKYKHGALNSFVSHYFGSWMTLYSVFIILFILMLDSISSSTLHILCELPPSFKSWCQCLVTHLCFFIALTIWSYHWASLHVVFFDYLLLNFALYICCARSWHHPLHTPGCTISFFVPKLHDVSFGLFCILLSLCTLPCFSWTSLGFLTCLFTTPWGMLVILTIKHFNAIASTPLCKKKHRASLG